MCELDSYLSPRFSSFDLKPRWIFGSSLYMILRPEWSYFSRPGLLQLRELLGVDPPWQNSAEESLRGAKGFRRTQCPEPPKTQLQSATTHLGRFGRRDFNMGIQIGYSFEKIIIFIISNPWLLKTMSIHFHPTNWTYVSSEQGGANPPVMSLTSPGYILGGIFKISVESRVSIIYLSFWSQVDCCKLPSLIRDARAMKSQTSKRRPALVAGYSPIR